MMETPSRGAIERETANLRTLRRISTSDSPPLDPDLSIPNGHPSPWNDTNSPTPDSPRTPDDENDDQDDPSHLFWVPAHLHPELAPAEFRAFLKEHANAPPPSASPIPIARTLSGASSLGRKKSMLSKQYKPRVDDGVEDEAEPVPKRRNRNSFYGNGPQLSVGDLQRLEELAEEASKSDDPNHLRGVLRRSLSLNMSPSVIDKMDNIGDSEDPDDPIILPPPSQILRRTARTKIRKASLQGDGGGHRFGPRRSGRATAAAPDPFLALEQKRLAAGITSEDDQSDSSPIVEPGEFRDTFGTLDRPLSYSEESAIYESYADRRESMSSAYTDDDGSASHFSHVESLTPPVLVEPPESEPQSLIQHPTPSQSQSHPQDPPYQHPPASNSPQPQPQPSHLSIPAPAPVRSPSPGSDSIHSEYSSQSAVSPISKRKEKEKKGGLFGKAKIKKEKPKGLDKAAEREKEKEKDSGFFGSLFGGGKKKHEESPGLGHGAGPAAAAALLGASKSKSNLNLPGELATPGGAYARYPIHVERAVYRLSHIKLANPRRPLYEQVLISNLMFWYLGIINKPTSPAVSPGPSATAAAQAAKEKEEKEKQEREKAEKERQEKELAARRESPASGRKGTLTKTNVNGVGSAAQGSMRRAEMPIKAPQYGVGMVIQHEAAEQQRRATSTPTSLPAGYDPYYNDPQSPYPSNSRSSSTPNLADQGQHPPQQYSRPPQTAQQQQPYYHDQSKEYSPYESEPQLRSNARSPPPSNPRSPPRSPPSLPPGAMPPVSPDHNWLGQSPSPYAGPPNPRDDRGSRSSQDSHSQIHKSPSPPSSPPSASAIRQRSPSYTGQQVASPDSQHHKLQGRSLSASAVQPGSGGPSRTRSPPPPRPTRSRSRTRDGSNPSPPPPLPANVNVPGIRAIQKQQQNGVARNDEDLPLAVYQKQQQQNAYNQSHPQPQQPRPSRSPVPQQERAHYGRR